MSSLRPLATITLLAAVGVFLYMKINETEPPLPAGVNWDDGSLEIGDGGESTTAATAPAKLPPLGDAGEAPAYSTAAPAKTAVTSPKTAAPAATDDSAPPWSPGPLAIAEPAAAPPAAAAAQTNDESSPVARTAEPPAVPAVPPLPSTTGAASTARDKSNPGAAVAAAAAVAAPAAALAAKSALDDQTTPTADVPPVVEVAGAPQPSTTPASPPTANAAAPTPPTAAPAQSSMFAAARVAVQGALDRGELAQALLLLSDWYDDPSLTPAESKEVEGLLSQLAGSVIYEGPPAHRLEKAYLVQSGETLETIAAKYDVPWQLLAKINGIAQPNALQPGQELKVLRGPFSALVDLSERRLTLMLDRRYAGQFTVELDPTTSIEEGQWKVDQKLLTPSASGVYGAPTQGGEDRSLLLASLTNPSGPPAVVRGPGATDPVSAEPKGRIIRLKGADVNDIYDILSEGSRVTIRR